MRKSLICGILASGIGLASPAMADGGLSFKIVGDTLTQPFTITNTSTAGEFVTGFGIQLKPGFGFDTVANPPGTFGINDATPFTPTPASVAATGYTGPAAFADGSTSLNFTFTKFGVGKSFVWTIDVDAPPTATVNGNDLIGSTGYADFSNGLRGTGNFQALGTNGSQFVITTFTPSPSVPEPASWAMFIGGFGAVGAAMRRRAIPGLA